MNRALADLIDRRVPAGGPGLTLLVLRDGAPFMQVTSGLARFRNEFEALIPKSRNKVALTAGAA